MSVIAPRETRLAPEINGRRRVLCAHRARLGDNGQPNSLEAVVACVAAGAPRIEIDVQFLADDRIAVLHDAMLDGDADGAGPVSLLTADQVRRIAPRTGHRIALLEDVVDAVRGTPTQLQVDLKPLDPLTIGQRDSLMQAIRPLGDGVLLGSRAHWSLRAFADTGVALAFDPTLLLAFWDGGLAPGGIYPSRTGQHGFWDDHPTAHLPGLDAREYLAARVAGLCDLVPSAVEWMVNVETILAMARSGYRLGEELGDRGVELAAWTLIDGGQEVSGPLLRTLIDLDVTTFITDHPLALAGYLAAVMV